MPLPTNTDLDDIFNIPKDGSNVRDESDESQEGFYADVITEENNKTFEQKSLELSAKLANETSTVMLNPKKEVITDGNTRQPEQSKSADSFETILSQSVSRGNASTQTIQTVVQESSVNSKNTNDNEDDKDDESSRDSVDNSVFYDQKLDDKGWFLNSPAPMFNHFYNEKASLVRYVTKSGYQLDIDKLLSELKVSTVSTNTELTDISGMADRLTKIQDFLDRVVQIKIQATSQAHTSKRGVELLRGILAKIIHEKPAARQDGVIYDHMRDIELYAARLSSLEQSAKDVYQNLLEAKEILSRKITIAFELVKEQSRIDGVEKNYNKLPQSAKESLNAIPHVYNKDYDRLEVQEEIVKNNSKHLDSSNKKTGRIEWTD
jgi:hypothetical protein